MTENQTNVNNAQEANPNESDLILLRGTIRNKYAATEPLTDGTPVYLIQSQECFEALGRFPNWDKLPPERIFSFDSIIPKLTADQNNAAPIFSKGISHKGYNCSPVIILYTKYDDNRIQTAQRILEAANVRVFIQDASQARDVITENKPELIQAEIDRQYSQAYSGAAYIEQFKAETTQARNPISTGYKLLNDLLDGGLYPGLYAIGGGTGTGKTSLMLNIADHVARNGHQVLIVSLEMSRAELFAKMISNITYIKNKELTPNAYNTQTTRDILKGGKPDETKEQRLIREESIEDFSRNVASYIYIRESIGTETVESIRAALEKHRKHTGKTPVLIVDYLQIMSNSDKYLRTNDKAKTDSNIVGLKQLSRDFETPVIVISSLNRESYKDFTQAVDLTSFKESGAIEYSCDVVLGLQLSAATDLERAKRAKEPPAVIKELEAEVAQAVTAYPKRMDIKVLKNRHGKNGGVIRYQFTPNNNHYLEMFIPPYNPSKQALTSFDD